MVCRVALFAAYLLFEDAHALGLEAVKRHQEAVVLLQVHAGVHVKDTVFGATAPLTEAGYQAVAQRRDDSEMRSFILRQMDAEGLKFTADGSEEYLNGFTPWFSGVRAVQSLQSLVEELRKASWVRAAQVVAPRGRWTPWRRKEPATVASERTQRERYMDTKLAVDTGVLNSMPPLPPFESAGTDGPGKVAFLFMVMEKVSWLDIWVTFFKEAPRSKFSIYVHHAGRDHAAGNGSSGVVGRALSTKKSYDDAAPCWEQRRHGVLCHKLPLRRFGAVEVPQVNSSWCALMGVQVQLLNAALRDRHNAQFIFLSQDTVPLKSFSYVHRNLVGKSPKTSKFCFADGARHEHALVEQLSNAAYQRCSFRDFYRMADPRVLKHHQWIVLAREHADIVAREARHGIHTWAKAWRRAAPDLRTMGEGCSDESVPATTLLLEAARRNSSSSGDAWEDLRAMGVERRCLTFVHWYNCFKNTNFALESGDGFLKSLHYRGEDLYRYLFDKDFDFVHMTRMNGFPTKYKDIELAYLVQLTNQGFMFGRKFPPGAAVHFKDVAGRRNVSLAELLPSIWKQVDEQAAAASEWQHLSGASA